MRVLVTGAAGFVGKWLSLELLQRGHEVIAGARETTDFETLSEQWRHQLAAVRWVAFELMIDRSVEEVLSLEPEAIVHLAAVASGGAARANPRAAWEVNCLGTCGLVYAIERLGVAPRLVLASTGEVYGRHLSEPAKEDDPVVPCSPYAASKLGAEVAALEYWRRTGVEVVVARPFAQTGPGQGTQFVAPALARRIRDALDSGESRVPVGNLEPIREFVDVRDVAVALAMLLEQGESGEVYNVASGQGISLRELFKLIGDCVGWEGEGVPDPGLFRTADIPYLVGDGSRLEKLGWKPTYDLRSTITDLVNAGG